MRRGEIFNLKWFDLDFDRGLIQVCKTKTKLNRVVPMNAMVREVLNQQRRTSEFVFTSLKTGGRLKDVKKAFNTARLEAGIPDFQLRDLRHSCATRLSDIGEELVTVAEILGHTDIRMTKRYSHGMQERKREALEKLVSFSPRRCDDKNVRKKTAASPPCRKSLILLVEQRGIEPLTSALRMGLDHHGILWHAVTCS